MVDLILFVAVVFVLSRLFQLDRVVTELSEREHRLQREVDRLAARLKVAAAAPDAVARAATDLAPDQARLRAEPPDARVAPQPSAAAPPVHPLPAAALPHEPTPAAPPSPPPATPPAPSVPTPLPARAEPTPPISPTAPTPRRVPPGAPSVRPAPPPRPAPTAQPAPAVRAEGTALVTPRAQPSSARPRPQRPQAAAARSWFGGGAALEELLGVRLYVWIGAVALALAGALLVKYTIDRGVLTPTMRIALGVAFGLALLGAGERLRRGTARIAAALSAAGVAVLFASFYAGSTVYEIVPAAVGFVLMALTAGTGVFLSLRHGPGVAAVGLMGGFLTPALVSSEAEPQAAPLFIYLFLLQAAMTQVARRRGWWAMTALSVVAGLAWFGAWLAGTFQPGDAFWLQVYLVAATGNLVAAARRGDAGGDADAADAPKHAPAWMPVASAFATLLLSAVVVHLSGYTWQDWAVVALLGGATLLLGRMARVYESLSWVAAAVTGTSLLAWGVQGRDAEALTIPLLARSVHPFLLAAGLFGALYAVGAYANVWRSRRPVVWAGLSAVSVLWFYGIAFFGHSIIRFTISSPFGVAREWGGVGLVLAAVVVAAAVPLLRRRTTLLEGATVATAPLACAAVLFALGCPLALSESSSEAAWSLVAVAWALDVLAVVWAAWRFGLPLLRRLAWPLGALVAGALLTPIVALVEWGTHPLFTWLIVAYGPPAGAFAVAAWVARRDGARRLSTALQWGAVALGLVGSTLMVRQWFHPGDLLGGGCLLAESGTYAALWLAVGTALVVASRRWAIDVAAQGGRAIVALGIGGAFAGPMLLANPLRTDVLVGGWPVLNGLLYPFILPAVLAVLVARVVHDPDRPFLGRAATATWLALATVLVGLEVRHGFHVGTPLRSGALGLVEAATYPIAWMGLGLILLRARDRFPRDVPEIGALSVIALGLAAVAAPVALVNPLSDAEAVGRWPVANWLLYAYGVPAAIAAVVARKVRDTGSRALAGAATVTWLALITLLVGLDVRHAFDRTALLQGISDLIEAATYPIAWLVLGLVLLRARPRFPRDVPELGGPAVVLLGLVACLCQPVATWLLWSKDAIGSWPVLNGLLYAYGVPAALAIVAARELRRIGVPDVAAAARATWLILVTAFVAFEVRHAFEGVLPPHAATVRLVESATYAIVWMVLGLVLMRLRSRFPEDVPAKGPEAVVTLGLVAVAGPLVVLNPLWEHIAVGTQRLLNVLPYVYGLPAALAVLAARELRRAGADVWLSRAAGGLGVGLGFVLVNLLVRQGFHGTYLDTGPLSVPENYAYSLAWVLYGAALLVAGVAGGGRLVRWASLLVMLLAVGKVFLYDTANLRDLYRVVSFLGLGLSLIGLGWVYQRFVFRSEEAR